MSWFEPFMNRMTEENKKYQDEQLARRRVATATQPGPCTLHGPSPRERAQCNNPRTTSRMAIPDGSDSRDTPLPRASGYDICAHTTGSSNQQPPSCQS